MCRCGALLRNYNSSLAPTLPRPPVARVQRRCGRSVWPLSTGAGDHRIRDRRAVAAAKSPGGADEAGGLLSARLEPRAELPGASVPVGAQPAAADADAPRVPLSRSPPRRGRQAHRTRTHRRRNPERGPSRPAPQGARRKAAGAHPPRCGSRRRRRTGSRSRPPTRRRRREARDRRAAPAPSPCAAPPARQGGGPAPAGTRCRNGGGSGR